ncbi:MAG: phage tail protein [Neptuniibacter sp. Phe_28]|jgi:phage tail protein X|nr:MAG: phage tail protein [Neptuniibacter sp. Phe_28]
MDTIRASQGDTIDLICHNYYGTTYRTVEAVYDANPGLADIGPVLPNGQLINLPALTTTQPVEQTVSLWS